MQETVNASWAFRNQYGLGCFWRLKWGGLLKTAAQICKISFHGVGIRKTRASLGEKNHSSPVRIQLRIDGKEAPLTVLQEICVGSILNTVQVDRTPHPLWFGCSIRAHAEF